MSFFFETEFFNQIENLKYHKLSQGDYYMHPPTLLSALIFNNKHEKKWVTSMTPKINNQPLKLNIEIWVLF